MKDKPKTPQQEPKPETPEITNMAGPEMAVEAEKMGQLQDYLQEGPHWSGKWDIGKS